MLQQYMYQTLFKRFHSFLCIVLYQNVICIDIEHLKEH